jgi:hypothetical protein
MPYRFEPLDKGRHERKGFRCSVPALTNYLQQQARKDAERNVAATFVMVDEAAPSRIIGYYTLSSFSVELTELPEQLRNTLPLYPRLPATLIGRLAREEKCPGTGSLLLVDALARAYGHKATVASIAVVAEAKDDSALKFYRKYGFTQLGAEKNRVFLPMEVIGRLIAVHKP